MVAERLWLLPLLCFVLPPTAYSQLLWRRLKFWRNNITRLNRKALGVPRVPLNASAWANSDASSVACGAILGVGKESLIAHKNLSDEEKTKSSTWRELEALAFGLRSFSQALTGKTVFWKTDNQAVPTITNRGSNKKHLQELAKSIYYTCRTNTISLNVKWIPRDLNVIADEISKQVDYDDWTTSQTFFEKMDQEWGPHTIDRLQNAKTKRYNAGYWNPNCEAVDAFSQDWGDETNWLVPPIYLVPKTILHARACQAKGTLIVPWWESAPYWPMLRNKYGFRRFVTETKLFRHTIDILELGDYKKSLLGSPRFTSPLIAVKFEFGKITHPDRDEGAMSGPRSGADDTRRARGSTE